MGVVEQNRKKIRACCDSRGWYAEMRICADQGMIHFDQREYRQSQESAEALARSWQRCMRAGGGFSVSVREDGAARIAFVRDATDEPVIMDLPIGTSSDDAHYIAKAITLA